MSGPVLSVVVAWQGGPLAACLEALADQEELVRGEMEVRVVAGVRGEDPPLPPGACDFHWIAASPGPAGRSLPRLLGAGAAGVRTPWIAFTESCCRPAADWARSLIDVCRATEAVAVGGAVAPVPGLSPLERALAICDYAPFLPPFAAGTVGPGDELPGVNVAFRRRALPPPSALERDGFWKTFHCRRLAARGERLYRDPRPLVFTARQLSPRGMARRRYLHGRCFGAMRAARISVGRRIGIAAAAPVLPVVLSARSLRYLWSAGRTGAGALGLLPLILALHGVWIVGEVIGNTLGAGDACQHL